MTAAQAELTKRLNESVKRTRLDYLKYIGDQRSEISKIYTIARADVAASIYEATSDASSYRSRALLSEIDGILIDLSRKEFDTAKRVLTQSAILGNVAAASVAYDAELAKWLKLTKSSFPIAGSNIRAVNALLAADYTVLSKRIWSHKDAALSGIRQALAVGAAQGRSTNDIVKSVIGYVADTPVSSKEFEKHMASYRSLTAKAVELESKALGLRREASAAVSSGKRGNMLVDRAKSASVKAASYRSAARSASKMANACKVARNGLYVSMEANAWRMVRHMTNLGYREGYLAGARKYGDFVYQQWTLSTGHRCCDICDDFANYDNGHGPGVYLVENYPGVPHVGCLCYPVPWVDWSRVRLEG